MKLSVAVLLDGGQVLRQLQNVLYGDGTYRALPDAAYVERLAHACYRPDEERLFRIYYYDCWPYAGMAQHPLTGEWKNFKEDPEYERRTNLYQTISTTRYFAFRSGELQFRGWSLKPHALKELSAGNRYLKFHHIGPDFQQKGVDIKIGLDISWLATQRIVDRVILFTADTDFIPAMKFARSSGVQVVIASLEEEPRPIFKEHADEFRLVTRKDLYQGSEGNGAGAAGAPPAPPAAPAAPPAPGEEDDGGGAELKA